MRTTRTKTHRQLTEQWLRIADFCRRRGRFRHFYAVYCRYALAMYRHNGESVHWHSGRGFDYNERNNAPVPVDAYTAST